MVDFKYKPDGEVLKTFMKDNTFFRGIRGPVGSGKSVGCCIEVFRRALGQNKGDDGIRKSRWTIIRIPLTSSLLFS
jgi:pantothenate kinase-related protein Tda10